VSQPFTPPVRFARLALKVNAFLLIALLLVAAFLGLVAWKQGWFVHQTGINKGMPVKLFGFTIGTVSDMRLAQNGVAVRMSINSIYLERIPRGSRAKFSRESGVVGASVIEIIPGRGEQPIAEDEYMDFEPARGLADIIDDFRRQAVPAFNEIKQTMSQFNRSGEEVTTAMIALRREIDQIPETHRAVKRLLDSATRTSESLERLTGTLDRAGFAGKLITTLDSLNRTAGAAEETMLRIKPAVEIGEGAARDAGEIIAAAKRSWPLKEQYRQGEALLPIDSFEAYGISSQKR